MNNSYTTLVDSYKALLNNEDMDNWDRGDIARVVTDLDMKEREERGNSRIIEDFLSDTGESRGSFTTYRWVADQYPDPEDRRVPGVRWGHYRLVGKLQDRMDWIRKASENGWTYRDLQRAMKEEGIDVQVDLGYNCPVCDQAVEKSTCVSVVTRAPKGNALLCSLTCTVVYVENLMGQENVPVQEVHEELSPSAAWAVVS